MHGFLGSSSDWKNIINGFFLDYYCIAIDLPGHGLSEIDKSTNSYNIENTAKYIVELLQSHNIKKCNLLGYSMGGRIAIYLAIHHSEYFNRLIIESAQPGIKDTIERGQRKNHDKKLAQKLISQPFSAFLEFWYNQPIFKTLKNQKNFANLMESRLKNNPRNLAKSLSEIGAGAQPSLWEDLKKIKHSCLLIAGELDTKYQKIFSKMHKEIFSSKFVIIKNAGHNVHLENPNEFIKVVRKFLRN